MTEDIDGALARQLVLTTRRRSENAHCTRCGEAFHCGAVSAESHCWCFDLPKLDLPDAGATACYCPRCLRSIMSTPANTED